VVTTLRFECADGRKTRERGRAACGFLVWQSSLCKLAPRLKGLELNAPKEHSLCDVSGHNVGARFSHVPIRCSCFLQASTHMYQQEYRGAMGKVVSCSPRYVRVRKERIVLGTFQYMVVREIGITWCGQSSTA